jgi:tetratricopeptide (TPR) repeat protein
MANTKTKGPRALVGVLALGAAFSLGVVVGEHHSPRTSPVPAALGPESSPIAGHSVAALPVTALPVASAVLASFESAARVPLADEGKPGDLGDLLARVLTAETHGTTDTSLLSSETSLLAEWLTERRRLDDAYRLLLECPADSPEVYTRLGAAFAQAGRRPEANHLYSEALRREYWDDELIDRFVELDAGACLAALEREARSWPDPQHGVGDDLEGYRAQALQALGRSAEAVALLRSPESLFQAVSGCVPAHLEGEPWVWRAWMAVEPGRVEETLLRIVRAEHASKAPALCLLAELYAGLGRTEDLERELAAWIEREPDARDYSRVVVELAPIRGWDDVRELLSRRPWDSGAALGLGEHLAATGRLYEAAEVWGEFLVESWKLERDEEQLAETVSRAPARLLPRLEALVIRALGNEDELDPEQDWSWFVRQAELGVNPR